MVGDLLMLDTLTRRPLPRGCTFDENDWHILSRHWYPVALVRELDEGPVRATLLDEQLVLYRSAEHGIVVANDICPHRGVPLSLGSFDGEAITCAYHGLRFGAEGRCIKIPAHPDRDIPSQFHLATYPAVEAYGLVWTCLAPTPGADPVLPPMPHWNDAGFQQITCPWMDIFGFAGRQMEGFLDVAHFGFVHSATFGDPDNLAVPSYKTMSTNDGFEAEYRSSIGNYPIGMVDRGREGFEWLRHFRCHLPFTATLTVHFPEGGRLVIMNAACPSSARVTRLFAPIGRNFDTDLPVQAVYDFNYRVFMEDKAIVEAQRPECLPLDPSMEAHFPADRSSMAYRKGLRDMGLSRLFAA
ncbi:molybdenum cofactor-independent xanthine hydroxylase subunit HpxD [soil metagenome]